MKQSNLESYKLTSTSSSVVKPSALSSEMSGSWNENVSKIEENLFSDTIPPCESI